MFSRNRLDITWTDLFYGLYSSFFGRWSDAQQNDLDELWHSDGIALSTVRTAWDALLTELNLPKGSEVLCSAVNIPDMFMILENHGLVPVPLDLQLDTLSVSENDWKHCISERTKLILVTHLLGSRNPLDALFQLAEQYHIPVVEDCAQAFESLDYRGDQRALASLFSFGPIKTRSSLGGAVAIIRDRKLREQVRTRCCQYARQSTMGFLIKTLKYSAMKMLSVPFFYAIFVWICPLFGKSHDQVINGAVLGLKGDDYYKVLRMKPAIPLLHLLKRQLLKTDNTSLESRREAGEEVLSCISEDVLILGRSAEIRTWWQFCIVSHDPKELIQHLRKHKFDATDGSSRLAPASPPEGYSVASRTEYAMRNVVYVPAYPHMGSSSRKRLAAVINMRPELLATFSSMQNYLSGA